MRKPARSFAVSPPWRQLGSLAKHLGSVAGTQLPPRSPSVTAGLAAGAGRVRLPARAQHRGQGVQGEGRFKALLPSQLSYAFPGFLQYFSVSSIV